MHADQKIITRAEGRNAIPLSEANITRPVI